MRLCVDDEFKDHPSAADVRRAIDAGPHAEGWYVVLDSDDDTDIEAAARSDGRYDVTAADGQCEL